MLFAAQRVNGVPGLGCAGPSRAAAAMVPPAWSSDDYKEVFNLFVTKSMHHDPFNHISLADHKELVDQQQP